MKSPFADSGFFLDREIYQEKGQSSRRSSPWIDPVGVRKRLVPDLDHPFTTLGKVVWRLRNFYLQFNDNLYVPLKWWTFRDYYYTVLILWNSPCHRLYYVITETVVTLGTIQTSGCTLSLSRLFFRTSLSRVGHPLIFLLDHSEKTDVKWLETNPRDPRRRKGKCLRRETQFSTRI